MKGAVAIFRGIHYGWMMAGTRTPLALFPNLILLLTVSAGACDPQPVDFFKDGPVTLSDLNPDSPTYDEERSLKSPPGKAVIVYFVSYS